MNLMNLTLLLHEAGNAARAGNGSFCKFVVQLKSDRPSAVWFDSAFPMVDTIEEAQSMVVDAWEQVVAQGLTPAFPHARIVRRQVTITEEIVGGGADG